MGWGGRGEVGRWECKREMECKGEMWMLDINGDGRGSHGKGEVFRILTEAGTVY